MLLRDQRLPIWPVRGFTSRAKPNKAAMATGDAMKKAVSMIRVKTNRNKVLSKCTSGMRFEYQGERQQTVARRQGR